MKFSKVFIFAVFITLTFFFSKTADAAVNYSIPNGQSTTINELGTCYSVTNNTGKTLFIPTKSTEEWSSFYTKNISGVTKAACGCSASGTCGATANGGTCTSYSASSVTSPTTCSNVTVNSTCTGGSWTVTPGSYGSCSQNYRSCGASGACGATANGGTCTTYPSASVAWPGSCSGTVSTCNDGTWSPSPYANGSCSGTHSYSWATGGWSGCSSQCGGTQTREVYCVRDDGVRETGGICNTTSAPASSQSCNGNGTSCSSCNGLGCNYGSCSGSSCTAAAPTTCWSTPGMCSFGLTDANGNCTASDPSYYGQACTSSANSCGQTNSGTYSCGGTCSASTPSDSSCPVYGCTDPNALNYNSNANTNDGSCTYPVYGCTDPGALNYDPNATSNDGSCTYDSGGGGGGGSGGGGGGGWCMGGFFC